MGGKRDGEMERGGRGGGRVIFKPQTNSLPISLPLPLIGKQKPSLLQPLSMSSTEPTSNLENAMQLMIQTFHKYSGKEGDRFTLSRGELKELLTEELGNYLGNAQDKDAVDKVMGDLDANNDGEVDFTEFIILVGALTVACNDFFNDKKPEENK